MKAVLHVLGSLAGCLGIAFVVLRLNDYAEQIDISYFNLKEWTIVVIFALLYGTANLLLARAWWNLLTHFNIPASWVWSIKAYALSQLARYIPGNIFHLASRQALGMASEIPAGSLAKSISCELGLIFITALLFSILAIPLVWPGGISPNILIGVFGIFSFLTIVACLYVFQSLSITLALIWQMAFLSLSGLVFIGVLTLVVAPMSTLPVSLPTLLGAYIAAWLAGLATPGAPAGIGVREMVLLFLLERHIAQIDLLLVVLLVRGITVVGDLFFFFIASMFKVTTLRSIESS